MNTLYVSPIGSDAWSGTLPEPNAGSTDGPLATLTAARNRLRYRSRPPAYRSEQWLPTGIEGETTVILRDGIYPLTEPLEFGPEDTAPVTYTTLPGETAVLDGGTRITDWRHEVVHGRPCWVADLPEVARGHWYFHSLFVNGQRRSRPRLPKQDWYWIESVPGKTLDAALHEGSDRFVCRDGDIQSWANLSDAEVVVLHFWTDEHMPIQSFDPDTRLLVSSRRSIFCLKDDHEPRYAKYYVSNVFEALTEPGEWYLDRPSGRLYYLPEDGETPETAEVYAPRLTRLLSLAGEADQGRIVQNLKFVGLTFRHTDAPLPRGGWDIRTCHPGEGMRFWPSDPDYASAVQAASNVPGVITLRGAGGCSIEGCTIAHAGWYGIEIGAGCLSNRIVGNELFDLGAGGITMSGADVGEPFAGRTGYSVITDNHIHHGGRVFHQAVGILLRHTFGNHIAHNHIHDLYYTGISCGWVWGFMESVCRDNCIEKNHIHHLGFGWLSDMGGIYTVGVQPGTVIRGNVIHHVERANYGGWGVYLDEGSSHIIVEQNVTYDTSSEGFLQHYGRENFVRNNIFVAGRDAQVCLAKTVARYRGFTFQHNIVVSENNAPLYAGAYGCDLRAPGFVSDYNLFWSTDGPLWNDLLTEGDPMTMQDLQAAGLDCHSTVADPQFADLARRDLRLLPGSPAPALGFQEFSVSDVGPRAPWRRDLK